MDDDPRKLATLVRLSRTTKSVLWQSIFFAIVIKGGCARQCRRPRSKRRSPLTILDFCWMNRHWPAFNLADVAIFLGVALVVLASIFSEDIRRAHRFRRHG